MRQSLVRANPRHHTADRCRGQLIRRVRRVRRFVRPPRLIGGLVLSAVSVLGVGCIGPRNYENDNDELRAQRLKQQRLIEKLQDKLEDRTEQIATLKQQRAGARPMAGVDAPALTKINFGRYSSVLDRDGDGKDDLVRLYVQPVDQQGRLIPVAGRATIEAAVIDADSPPKIVAKKTYSPAEFDRAYRSTLLGRHYTLDLPLGNDVPSGKTTLTVKLTFTNAATGVKHTQQQAMTVKR